MKSVIPLDVESLSDAGAGKFREKPFWPVAPEIYDSLALKNLDFLFNVYQGVKGSEKILMRLVFRQIFMDFNFFACCLIDVRYAFGKNLDVACGKKSKLYNNIKYGLNFPAPPSMALDEKPLKEKIKDFLRPMIKKGPAIRNVKATGTPLTFTNGITGTLRALRAERDIPEPVVIPNYFFSRIPPFSFRLPETANLADRIYSGWIDILESFSITLRKNEKSYIRRFALYYLSWGMRDIKATLPFDLENSVYFSGTGGGYWNRLIGCRVKAAGGRVIQMDHGGERPFFADRWWGINEFAFCDEFVTFTAAGAVAIKRNIEKEYRTLLENPSALEVSRLENNNFTSLAPSAGKNGRADEAKSIMFVPTGFMGEFNTVPSFTIHDVPYAIFQIKILEALERSGKKIFYKQAPKALLDALFSPEKYGAEIVRGKLSECLELPDAFLFTFAGTAFCEALCTDKPVVFLKVPPFRPQTNEQEQEFASACRIIRGSLDSGNCPDINMEKLKSAFATMTETELENRRKFRKKWLTGK